MRLSELGLRQCIERKAIVWLTSICFTFGKVNLVPTIEEYMALLRCSKFQIDKVYSRTVNVPTFSKKLMSITGMNEQ
ncbi:hypothetical protein Goshw_007463 [Gossypium schwendimanii]|uniref:Uncharacterized protein n=1 Tax=Gossypium schwendimanii TaxID=34291 RepID=A0A7J9N440_GOSSC|nr:hypothetical protein [Gossypium schwendimanii]